MSAPDDVTALNQSDLKQQLDAKDQLVRALTDRLEEAAEQLDRVQRTGGDKGGRTGGSSEGSGSHPLLEKLSKSFELWEDVQPRDAFARIEERLEELRDMLEGAIVAQPGEGASKSTKHDTLSGWEKMKAQLMQEDDKDVAQQPPAGQRQSKPQPQPVEKTESAPAPAEKSQRPAPQQPERPLSEMKLPEPVDFETAPRLELEEAITTRDQYIGELTRRLRSAESRTYQQIDWAALNDAPDDLRETLQVLEAELTDRLRIAEVDLSLERARLSRVENRIRATQLQIEKRLQQSAGNAPDAEAGKSKATTNKSQTKSWFGSLGR